MAADSQITPGGFFTGNVQSSNSIYLSLGKEFVYISNLTQMIDIVLN